MFYEKHHQADPSAVGGGEGREQGRILHLMPTS